MNDILNNSPIDISVIDYIGKIKDGVGILLSLVVNDNSYEIGYWFNKKGDIRLTPEPKLLNKLNINNIYEYKYINELIYLIHNSIPNTDKILKEFIDK